MKKIYLDYAATTPVDPEVLEAMKPYFLEKYGNAGSLHSFGQEARDALEKARNVISKFIGARSSEIIFTGVGTEANNLAIKGIAFANKDKGKHIITSKIEHPAILEPCKWLEKQGFRVTYLPIDAEGLVRVKDVETAISDDTILVSIMFANNEIGTIQKIKEIGDICKKHKVYFHTDAVQAFGKIPIDVKKMNIDLLTASAHKIYGPKGVGMLYVDSKVKIEPILHGGGHETGLRSGTENIAGVVGFAKAVEMANKEMKSEMKRQQILRDKIISNLLQMPGTRLNGSKTERLPNNVNISFIGVEGEALLIRLNQEGLAVSTGSACSSKSLEPSHVLLALGLKPEEAHGSLRITLGKYTTDEDVDKLIEVLPKIIKSLRKISPF